MRYWLIISVLSLIVAAGHPARGGAEKQSRETAKSTEGAATPEQGAGHDHGDGEAGGVEKIFGKPKALIDLGIWTLVVFLLLLVVLGRFAWKPLIDSLQKRERNILDAKEAADKARAEAEELRAKFRVEVEQASQKAAEIRDEARTEGERIVKEMTSSAQQTIESERERHLREIETAKEQALHEIWSRTAELAAAISSKAINRQLSVEDHRRLADEAIAEIGKQGSESA